MSVQVDGLPGYVLEPDSRGVRELNVQNFQSGLDRNDPGLSMMTSDSTVTLSICSCSDVSAQAILTAGSPKHEITREYMEYSQ